MRTFAVAYAAIALLAVATYPATHADEPKFTPAASDHQPPRFLPAVALYINNRFQAVQVGKDFQFTCKAALDDTASAIAKAVENGPPGTKAVGFCIPIPTYDPADLAEGQGQKEPPKVDGETVL
jgi:hypothetical protein